MVVGSSRHQFSFLLSVVLGKRSFIVESVFTLVVFSFIFALKSTFTIQVYNILA